MGASVVAHASTSWVARDRFMQAVSLCSEHWTAHQMKEMDAWWYTCSSEICWTLPFKSMMICAEGILLGYTS